MMKTSELLMNFSVDKANRRIQVSREFNAPVSKVWEAWTKREILDQWWAPKPWRAVTKSMDFREGGSWLYYMAGPDGEKQYCRADFSSIEPLKMFVARDGFCDENGKFNDTFPMAQWVNQFSSRSNNTLINIEIRFENEAGVEKYIESGFKEGFLAALENLDNYLSSH